MGQYHNHCFDGGNTVDFLAISPHVFLVVCLVTSTEESERGIFQQNKRLLKGQDEKSVYERRTYKT